MQLSFQQQVARPLQPRSQPSSFGAICPAFDTTVHPARPKIPSPTTPGLWVSNSGDMVTSVGVGCGRPNLLRVRRRAGGYIGLGLIWCRGWRTDLCPAFSSSSTARRPVLEDWEKVRCAIPSIPSALNRKGVLVLGTDAASRVRMERLRDMPSSSPVEFRQYERRGEKQGRTAAGVVPTADSQQWFSSLRSFCPSQAGALARHTHTHV